MTGRFRLGKISIFIRDTAKTLPRTMDRTATITVYGCRSANMMGFMGAQSQKGAEGRRFYVSRPRSGEPASAKATWVASAPGGGFRRLHLSYLYYARFIPRRNVIDVRN